MRTGVSKSIARRKGNYGIDAPYLLPVPLLLLLGNLVSGFAFKTVAPFVGSIVILACTCLGLHASRRGKFLVWDELLDGLSLKGNEEILDIGCGRGAVLLLAAERLKTGRAVGVDLWRKSDQSGNALQATEHNALAEGVADRVELRTANMTSLPFQDQSFDLVLSNVAIHNAKGSAARSKTIEEAVRVLRPSGRLLIADIWATREYRTYLENLGMKNISYRSLGWRLWWSGPWLATWLVSATKPV